MEYHVTLAVFPVFLLLVFITCCSAHGGMQEPPMRSLAWRYGFDVPINYDWNSLYCGGFFKFQQSGGKCGLCGDPYDGPFENDRGGPYDTGVIVRHYPAGMRQIDVKFELTAYHKGNSHGRDNNGTSCIGCGLQETFVNCADISIGGTVDNISVRDDTISPEADIVIPQTADVTQIIDEAPSDSFEAVIRALRGIQQFADRRFNAPGANVATQDSGMVGTRRGAGDHPGINPDQMNVPQGVLPGAGMTPRRVLPGLQPNRNRVPDLPGISADQIQSMGSFDQTNLFPGHLSNVGGMSIFGDPIPASRRNVDLPRPSIIHTVRDINLQDRRFNTLSRTDDSNQKIHTDANQRQRVQNSLQRGQMTPFTLMVNPNVDPSRRSLNDRLIPITFASDPNKQSLSVPNRSGVELRTPIKRPNNQAPHNLANPLERSNVHSSLISSISDTISTLPKQIQHIQAGRSIFSTRNSGFPQSTTHGSALGVTSGLARNTLLQNGQRNLNGKNDAVIPPKEFVAQMNRMRQVFPNPEAWHRGDGMTSPREAVRQAPHLDTRDFSTTDIRQHVPKLPSNIGLRQDVSPLMQRREQQNSQAFVQNRRMRAHSDGLHMRNGQSSPFSLPRRIEVDSMTVAQHLLRKYPQLRGRITRNY
ncbi:hypothetical protein MAR_034142 [Mya arenaria]|uniref:Chitin-binding type-4 domain-containing protein n=1 Tax=Mya arenaria TaxID=6604 RepID=A0ABY7GB10_MYAAR|nr:hypothetical protein MAR_034142 [Mya arenaria]